MRYPDTFAPAPAEQLATLGRRYLEETAPLRSGRAHFIDKMPNNFSHVGLIHAILPSAIVIDVRRHPMDACFSTFKQHFAEGQTFSYDLTDLGRYYRCYLSLMDHWDAVLPGRVLHVQYEEVVRDPEANIRRLLAHCGLHFEPACLNFHATRRRCARRAPSRCASRCTARASATGGISRASSSRCVARSGRAWRASRSRLRGPVHERPLTNGESLRRSS